MYDTTNLQRSLKCTSSKYVEMGMATVTYKGATEKKILLGYGYLAPLVVTPFERDRIL